MSMLSRSRTVTYRCVFTIFIILFCIISFKQFLSIDSFYNEEILHHKSVIYNLSDPFIMKNLIDQFLNTKDFDERDHLWLLLIQSWSNSFEIYFKRTQMTCSLSSPSSDFINNYLNHYTKNLLTNNITLQRRLTGFGLFFDYNPDEIRSKTHDLFPNIFLSSCTYFELIVLIMKVQLVLYELNIEYFIGQNTLIGAIRHHDIVPWNSIIEFNLPLNSKEKLIKNINKKFELVLQKVNDSFINEKQFGFVYKIFIEDKLWPQIEIYFYQENSYQIFDSKTNDQFGYLQKTDVFPLQLRLFGPIFLSTINNHQAMISNKKLNVCEIFPWNHQLGNSIDIDDQWRIPCKQLHTVYSFVRYYHSWRQAYCEETLKTKHLSYRTLSYFRYTCSENIKHVLR